ncbi:MAG: hypothetical protein KatS3mg032_1851 [Cyclobacteriaceae bacterium]|nr:MAG: hypothetical protein KatS3mg032_1851 [Cyclobacteriaceae bacterium]
MKINILRFFMPLLCLGFSAAILHSCSQDDAGPGNPTNGKTTAVFKPIGNIRFTYRPGG